MNDPIPQEEDIIKAKKGKKIMKLVLKELNIENLPNGEPSDIFLQNYKNTFEKYTNMSEKEIDNLLMQ